MWEGGWDRVKEVCLWILIFLEEVVMLEVFVFFVILCVFSMFFCCLVVFLRKVERLGEGVSGIFYDWKFWRKF